MLINIKEKFFSKWLKIHKIFYGKSCKHWGNSFILRATDVKWTVTTFSIAQVFQQCNFTIASNYNVIVEKSVGQEECFATAKFNSYGCDQKHTPQVSLYIKFSFYRVSLAEIGELQLFTENAMALHSTIQGCIQIIMNYRVVFRSTIKLSVVWSDTWHPDIKYVPGFRSDWIGRFAWAKKQNLFLHYCTHSLGHLVSLLVLHLHIIRINPLCKVSFPKCENCVTHVFSFS